MTVQILMSTYNGEKYLREQIESLISQSYIDLKILVRDDGSTDGTIKILEEYKNLGILTYYKGENLKPARSFMDLIYNTPNAADYYAFCDQDDYWMPEKLSKAIEKINGNIKKPSLYFSKAQLVDEKLNQINHKGYPNRAYTFGEALIKNNATGCTIVFNKALLEVVKSYNPEFITMHDYWVYLICLAINGYVYYDSNSYIKYRQHDNNVVGGRRNLIKEYRNKLDMLLTKDKTRQKIAIELKNGYHIVMSDENKEIVDLIVCYTESFRSKINLIRDGRVYTISRINSLLFYIAVLFNAF